VPRRRYPEREDWWHVHYGDVHVGTILLSGRHSIVTSAALGCARQPTYEVADLCEPFLDAVHLAIGAAIREIAATCVASSFLHHKTLGMLPYLTHTY
jgi:hypothetical protein